MSRPTRRTFLKSAVAAAAGSALSRLDQASAAEPDAKRPRERPNVLYAVSTGCWGPVTPPGEPLPLLKILDETAAGGFNGVRLTGYPEILRATT